jgi:YHS domain-containing protein
MISSRWFAVAVSGAVLAAAFVLQPAVAEDAAKQAVCPVMGSKFTVSKNTQFTTVNGKPVYFCCAGCPEAFAKEPEKYVAKMTDVSCPVMTGGAAKATQSLRVLVNDSYYYMCCAGCPAMFVEAPEKYVTSELKDPVSGKMFKVSAKQPHVEHKGVHYFFADAGTKTTFEKSPDKYARKVN